MFLSENVKSISFEIPSGYSYFTKKHIDDNNDLIPRVLARFCLKDDNILEFQILTERVTVLVKRAGEDIIIGKNETIMLGDADIISVSGVYVFQYFKGEDVTVVRDGGIKRKADTLERKMVKKSNKDDKRQMADVNIGNDISDYFGGFFNGFSDELINVRSHDTKVEEIVISLDDSDDTDSTDQNIFDPPNQIVETELAGNNGHIRNTPSELNNELIILSLEPTVCEICYEELDVEHFHSIYLCKHFICKECLIGYINNAINQKDIPIKCPFRDCKSEILLRDLALLPDPILCSRYVECSLKSVLENDNLYRHCLTPDCTYAFFKVKGDGDQFKCPLCNKTYCLECQVDYHTDISCDQYKQWCEENGNAETKTLQFLKGKDWKICKSCNRWIEKNKGCNHMTCLCKNQFCYACEGPWPCRKCAPLSGAGNIPNPYTGNVTEFFQLQNQRQERNLRAIRRNIMPTRRVNNHDRTMYVPIHPSNYFFPNTANNRTPFSSINFGDFRPELRNFNPPPRQGRRN